MRIYTTPTLTFSVPCLISDSDIYITFTCRDKTLTFTTPDITVTEEEGNTIIEVSFTQEQTALFTVGEIVAVEVNWKKNNKRCATDIAYIKVTDNLLKEFL